MNFIRSLTIEIKKLKSTPALKLAVISGFFIPCIYFIYYASKWKSLIPKEGINPWDSFVFEQLRNSAPFLLPILFILQTSLVAQIEHKVNGFKYIFSQPIHRYTIYVSKLTSALLLLLVSYVAFSFAVYLSGSLAGLLHPELKLISSPFPIEMLLLFTSATLIANLGLFSIQFWLSMKFKNFIIPIGIGMVLLITGLIVYRAEESLYFPYSYSMYALAKFKESWFPEVIGWYSIICFVLFTVIGSVEITRKNIL